jgi:prepilin peptidase CpaA
VVVLAVATYTDLRSRRIPNWLVYPFLLAGITVAGWQDGWHGILHSLEGLALGALIYGIFFWLGGMGMGDVKLCAAIGSWIGPSQLLLAIVFAGIAGGIMAICWATFGGFLGDLFSGTSDLLLGWKKRGQLAHPELVLSNPKARKMPYAPAIAIGTLLSFFSH